jgi:hypothetical protein
MPQIKEIVQTDLQCMNRDYQKFIKEGSGIGSIAE